MVLFSVGPSSASRRPSLQTNRAHSTIIGLHFSALITHVSCLQAIEGRLEHAYCIEMIWCYLAWGHFQLPEDPASKLTEHIVQ